MLFDVIGTQPKITREAAIAKYWGGDISSAPHPVYKYGCDALPFGWREIDAAEFAASNFFWYSPIATGWLRCIPGDARLFFMHDDTGFALIRDKGEKSVRFYKFGCQHDSTSEEVGRCLTKYTCKKCGYVSVIDSSD